MSKLFTIDHLVSDMNYDSEPDYLSRFTIIEPTPQLFRNRSYDSEPDYIDEMGNEVRINKNRPNEKRVGRFTIVDEPTIKRKKKKSNKKSLVGKLTKDVNLYPGKKIGRFTVKNVTKSRKSNSGSGSRKSKSRSPKLKK